MVDVLGKLRNNTSGLQASPVMPTVGEDDPFKSFWDTYGRIQAKINDVEYTLQEVQQIDEDMQTCPDMSRVGSLRIDLQSKLGQIQGTTSTIRSDLETLQNQVNDNDDANPGSPEVRLQRNHVHQLTNNFTQIAQRFQQLNTDIKRKFAEQVARQYEIAGVEMDKDEIDRVCQENPGALQENLFVLRGGHQTQEIVSTYNMIAERQRDVMEIERSANEVLDLFVQFSVIVQDQGRIIDNIESNLATAKDYVEKGREYLEKAKESQKKGRKWLWMLVLLALVVLVAVVVLAVVL